MEVAVETIKGSKSGLPNMIEHVYWFGREFSDSGENTRKLQACRHLQAEFDMHLLLNMHVRLGMEHGFTALLSL